MKLLYDLFFLTVLFWLFVPVFGTLAAGPHVGEALTGISLFILWPASLFFYWRGRRRDD